MRGTCTVSRVEAVEVVTLTKSIDAAVVSILAALADMSIAQDLVRDLTEIASASRYVRGVAEQALERQDDERSDVRASTSEVDIAGLAGALQSKARPQ